MVEVTVLPGAVRIQARDGETVLERTAGVCLSCRAVPITNIIIELQEGDRLSGGSLGFNSARH